jgi:hypothetical protein
VCGSEACSKTYLLVVIRHDFEYRILHKFNCPFFLQHCSGTDLQQLQAVTLL